MPVSFCQARQHIIADCPVAAFRLCCVCFIHSWLCVSTNIGSLCIVKWHCISVSVQVLLRVFLLPRLLLSATCSVASFTYKSWGPFFDTAGCNLPWRQFQVFHFLACLRGLLLRAPLNSSAICLLYLNPRLQSRQSFIRVVQTNRKANSLKRPCRHNLSLVYFINCFLRQQWNKFYQKL